MTMNRHTPTATHVSTLVNIRFEFEGGDWCEAYLNESTGQLTLSTYDYSYTYRWNLGENLPCKPPYTLLRGIHAFGQGYLVDKLSTRDDVFDPEATKKAVLDYVKKELNWPPPDEELQALCFDSPDALLFSSAGMEWLPEPWCFHRFAESRRTVLLRERYVPALKAWVAEQVALPPPAGPQTIVALLDHLDQTARKYATPPFGLRTEKEAFSVSKGVTIARGIVVAYLDNELNRLNPAV